MSVELGMFANLLLSFERKQVHPAHRAGLDVVDNREPKRHVHGEGADSPTRDNGSGPCPS